MSCRRPSSVDDAELGHFTLLFFRGRFIYAREEMLFSSLNLLSSHVLVAVVVVVCLSSLLLHMELGLRSGESARLPPMCPGFDSRTRRHVWVGFIVDSLLCFERFFSGYSGFPLSSKTNISKFHFDLDVRHLSHEPLARVIAQALPVLEVKFTFINIRTSDLLTESKATVG